MLRWSVLALVLAVVQTTDEAAYRASIEKWRQEREAALKADDGFLTVAGLYFLQEGATGSAPIPRTTSSCRPVRPRRACSSTGPESTTVTLAEGTAAMIDGKAIREMALKPDSAEGGPDRVIIGDLSLFVHASGKRQAIRLRDKNSAIRREFKGCRWYSDRSVVPRRRRA